MSHFETILRLLDINSIGYNLYEHEPVYTSEQAAKVRGDVQLKQGAKSLVFQADEKFILFVLPGDLRADIQKLQMYLKVNKLQMASKESVKAKTGLEVGCIPPFGSVMGLKTYVDSRLGDNDEIAFNAARHDRSIKMKYIDFIKLEMPEIVDFK